MQAYPGLTLTELDPDRSARLSRRFADEPRVRVEELDILDPPEGHYSSLVAFNVLEHIEDHVGALRAAHRLVVPGGTVIMFVPAFMFAMGRFDRRVGHHRRYTLDTLRATYDAAGIEVERMHYVNAPGLAAWVVGVRLMGMTPGDSVALQVWDRTVTRASRAIERRISPAIRPVHLCRRAPRSAAGSMTDVPTGAGETGPIELTILMPCLNEAETLGGVHPQGARFLERSGVAGEVIVADNGSTDGSREIARAAGRPRRAGRRRAATAPRCWAASTRRAASYVIMGDADDSL